jgi:hypothetical protein
MDQRDAGAARQLESGPQSDRSPDVTSSSPAPAGALVPNPPPWPRSVEARYPATNGPPGIPVPADETATLYWPAREPPGAVATTASAEQYDPPSKPNVDAAWAAYWEGQEQEMADSPDAYASAAPPSMPGETVAVGASDRSNAPMVLFIIAAAILGGAILALAGYLLFGRASTPGATPTAGAIAAPPTTPATVAPTAAATATRAATASAPSASATAPATIPVAVPTNVPSRATPAATPLPDSSALTPPAPAASATPLAIPVVLPPTMEPATEPPPEPTEAPLPPAPAPVSAPVLIPPAPVVVNTPRPAPPQPTPAQTVAPAPTAPPTAPPSPPPTTPPQPVATKPPPTSGPKPLPTVPPGFIPPHMQRPITTPIGG